MAGAVEIIDGLCAAVHLLVFQAAHEHVGRSGGVAGAVGNHPTLGLVVVLLEEGRDRAENQVPRAQRTEVRVERAERETHHDLARGLRVDLRKNARLRKRRPPAGPLEADEFRVPPRRVHEIDKRLEVALSARHRRNYR